MAEYKVVNATELDNGLKGICDTIRSYPNSGYTETDVFSFPDGIKTAINTAAQNIADTNYGNGYHEGTLTGGGNSKDTEMLYSVLGRKGTELNCNISRFGDSACYNWTELTKARLPLGQAFLRYAFRACTGLKVVDIGDPTRTDIYVEPSGTNFYFNANAFNGCSALDTLILRPNLVAYLQAASAFTDTPLLSGTGKILVPASLVDQYKSATNWSTYADSIFAIEDYPEITGGAV